MKTKFNPETLEGISYVLYIHPDTGKKGVSSWPADGEKTHQWFLNKYLNVTALSVGLMDYIAHENVWLPFFESGCDRTRSEDERLSDMGFVAEVLSRRYADDTELTSCLGQVFEKKIASYKKRLIERNLPSDIISQKIMAERQYFK